MAQSIIQAGTLTEVSIQALPGDIGGYAKSGDDLIVQLHSGDEVLVQGFYQPDANGMAHKLVLGDGTVILADGTDEEELGLGAGMVGADAAVAGLGAAGVAAVAAS
ncbi:MAG: hypothetical protein COB97_07190, partial [Paracoccus sp.]